MSSPLQFGGPIALPADPTGALQPATKQYADTKVPYSYFTMLASPGGMGENSRLGSLTETIPVWAATGVTANTVRTVTALFPVGWDTSLPSRSFTGFKFWMATAPGGAQTVTYGYYTGAASSSLAQVGTNQSATALGTGTPVGVINIPFPSALAIAGTSPVWIGLKIVLGAPSAGSGATLAASTAAATGIVNFGGKYGEWTTATTAPGTTLDASAASASATANQLAWVALY